MDTLKKLLFWKAANGGSPLYERTIINNPAVFTTEVAKPLKGLSIPFTSETGLTGLNVYRTGKNLLDASQENAIGRTGYMNYTISGSSVIIQGSAQVGFIVSVKPNTKYAFSIVSEYTGQDLAVRGIESSEEISAWNTNFSFNKYDTNKYTFTTKADSRYALVGIYAAGTPAAQGFTISSFQVEVGATATEHKPYSGITIPVSFGETVNEGELDALTGVLTVTSPESKTVQLDPVTLSTLIGENVIWTDTNSDNTIVYLSKTQGGGLGGGFGGGFDGGSDEPDEPGDPDNPDEPEEPTEPEKPVTDE